MNRRAFVQTLAALVVAPAVPRDSFIAVAQIADIAPPVTDWVLDMPYVSDLGYTTRLGFGSWSTGDLVTADMMNEMHDLSIAAIRKDGER